jgi:phage gpG-like protein
MTTFTPFEFSEYLLDLVVTESLALNSGLKVVAEKIEKTAKSEIGHYQKSYAKFPAWAHLSESTIAEKESLGYSPPDNPLLRTGEMRDSISNTVEGLEATIGSNDQKMVWHEFGTSKMAMRPVLGPAAFRNRNFIVKTIGYAVVSGFYGNKKIHPNLGYDFEAGSE